MKTDVLQQQYFHFETTIKKQTLLDVIKGTCINTRFRIIDMRRVNVMNPQFVDEDYTINGNELIEMYEAGKFRALFEMECEIPRQDLGANYIEVMVIPQGVK
jgi:hypothetical protein